MVEKLKELRPKLHFFWVTWKYPNSQRLKCNTDGRSRGNLGLSSYGFCIRDDRGDLIFAEAQGIAITKYRRSGDRATKDESSDERLVRPSFYCKNILQEKRKGRRSSLVLDKVIKIHQEIGCETLTIEDEVDASSNGKKQARRGRRVDSFKESAENTFICKV
ncbi:hypothetical protein KY285_007890 [Solanum tuberosum]|nr:hypothetical protein KY285_007890 [Solanum tuberosum]